MYSLSAGFPPRVFEAGVTGDYPYLHFTDPLVAGCAYNLWFEDERDQIAGDCGTRSLVRFDRGGSGRCEVGGP